MRFARLVHISVFQVEKNSIYQRDDFFEGKPTVCGVANRWWFQHWQVSSLHPLRLGILLFHLSLKQQRYWVSVKSNDCFSL